MRISVPESMDKKLHITEKEENGEMYQMDRLLHVIELFLISHVCFSGISENSMIKKSSRHLSKYIFKIRIADVQTVHGIV